MVVLTLGVVYAIGRMGTQYPLALASLPLGLLLWSAVRYPPLVTLLGTSVVIICISVLTGLGVGGLVRPQTLHDSVLMMVMLVMYSIIPVLLLASRQEHAHTTAALHLRDQLQQQGRRVDAEHPLFVYLPCGVGGAPAGIAFGLRELLGPHVH